MGKSMNHPGENDLALLAGGEAGRIRRFLLDRHLRECADCRETVEEYRELRADVAELELPDLNWSFLAADIRANIHLGLEAGACVRATPVLKRWNLRPAIALTALLLLFVGGFFMRDVRLRPAVAEEATPVLQVTGSGVEVSSGTNNSLTLLNHHGGATNQTVSARGDIETRYIDSDTGSVTINKVYAQ
jgi:hypothetical protein